MSAERRKEVRAITQTVGAHVVCSDGGVGEVTGHYDDDSVYVLFEGERTPTRTWTTALKLAALTGEAQAEEAKSDEDRCFGCGGYDCNSGGECVR